MADISRADPRRAPATLTPYRERVGAQRASVGEAARLWLRLPGPRVQCVAEPDDLEYPAQLVYWVGAVCLADVQIEIQLRSVWTSLAGGRSGAAERVQPDRYSMVIRDCRKMLEDDRILLEDRKAVLRLFADASDVHQQRNDLAHGAFVLDGDEFHPMATSPFRPTKSRRVWTPQKAKNLQLRARRLQSRAWSLAALRPGVEYVQEHDRMMSRAWCYAVIRDEFTLTDRGGIQVAPDIRALEEKFNREKLGALRYLCAAWSLQTARPAPISCDSRRTDSSVGTPIGL
jgi:hypothetical protein